MWALILKRFGGFLAIFAQDAIKQELAMITPIALEAIKAIAADKTNLTSEDKRLLGISYILNELKTKQKPVTTSLVNLGLEIAYQQFLLIK